ncbi:hypothetical protein GCM10017788_77560 [Amycolatopsis acidiphila]|nr:hypothetical protein GCM10017788_77560 [Amycolatopsis acidiphila]
MVPEDRVGTGFDRDPRDAPLVIGQHVRPAEIAPVHADEHHVRLRARFGDVGAQGSQIRFVWNRRHARQQPGIPLVLLPRRVLAVRAQRGEAGPAGTRLVTCGKTAL